MRRSLTKNCIKNSKLRAKDAKEKALRTGKEGKYIHIYKKCKRAGSF